MTFGSLFSGIGGLDLGLERAGMKCIWQCEIDSFCRKVLAKHWPGVTCYDDVRKIDDAAAKVDLLCGGFPCQPHSVAGKQKGKDDERNLWPECIRLVRLFRPSWLLFENVPGIFTTMFGQVCDEIRGEGYDLWPLVLGAIHAGARHRRKRVWFIAHANRNRLQRLGQRGSLAEKGINETRCSARGTSFARTSTNAFKREQSQWRQVGQMGWEEQVQRNGTWEITSEPWVCGRTNGIPFRMDRLKALGNAVVPQVAELIGRAIMSATKESHHAQT